MKFKILKVVLISFLIFFSYNIISNAGISSSDPTVDSGGSVSITLTSSEGVASFKSQITNAGGLTFISASKNLSFDSGSVNGSTINGVASNGEFTTLATYTFKVPEVTENTTYSVKFSITGMAKADFTAVSDDTTTSTVTVKAPVTPTPVEPDEPTQPEEPSQPDPTPTPKETKSDNSKLKTLTVSEGELSPEFNKNVKSYTVYVGSDIEKITIKGTTEDSNAKITSGTGTKKIKEGDNKINLVVRAEDESTTTYTVNVVKSQKIDLTLANLQITGLELNPKFSQDVYEYTAELKENATKLDVIATPNKENTPVEIVGATNIKEGENTITITLKSADGSETLTYKIVVNNPAKVIEKTDLNIGKTVTTSSGIDNKDEKEQEELLKKEIIIKIIIITVLIGITISIIYFAIDRYNENNEEDDCEEDDKDDEEDDDSEENDEDEKENNNVEDNKKEEEQEDDDKEETEEQIKEKAKFNLSGMEDRRKANREEPLERRKTKRDYKGKHF